MMLMEMTVDDADDDDSTMKLRMNIMVAISILACHCFGCVLYRISFFYIWGLSKHGV